MSNWENETNRPEITFGDNNTGIYRNSNDTLTMVAGGVNQEMKWSDIALPRVRSLFADIRAKEFDSVQPLNTQIMVEGVTDSMNIEYLRGELCRGLGIPLEFLGYAEQHNELKLMEESLMSTILEDKILDRLIEETAIGGRHIIITE